MKKALVATSVVAMMAFTVTSASADTVGSARANAYGINIGGSLLDQLVEREPEVTSVLPPGGQEVEDIITADADPITISGTGIVVAETSPESTIVPFLSQNGLSGGDGNNNNNNNDGLLGGIFDNLLGGNDNNGGGGLLGGGSGGGGGLLNSTSSNAFQAQQLGGGNNGGDNQGTLGGLLGNDLLGGLLDNGNSNGQQGDDQIQIPAANARGFARIEDLNVVIDNSNDTVISQLQALIVDALLEVDTVTAEAVAVCVQNQVFFDTASSILSLNDEPVSLVNDLVDSLGEILPRDLIDIRENEIVTSADGVGVNALHVTVGGNIDDITGGTTGGDGTTGGVTGGDNNNGLLGDLLGGGDGGGGGLLGGGSDNEPLIDIVLGHAEVSAVNCAAQPAAPTTTLQRTGDEGTLPRTGGGLGALPTVAAIALLGGGLTAGRLVRRSRNGTSL